MVDEKHPGAKSAPAETQPAQNEIEETDNVKRPPQVKEKVPSDGDAIADLGDEVGGPA